MVEYWLRYDPNYNINQQDPVDGNTPLHNFIRACSCAMNSREYDMMHSVVVERAEKVINLIYTIFPTVDVNTENGEGETILDLVIHYIPLKRLIPAILKKDFQNINKFSTTT